MSKPLTQDEADIFDSMVDGSYEPEEVEVEEPILDDVVDDDYEEDEETDIQEEDTDSGEDSEDDEELDDLDDGEDDEDSEDEDDSGEEDTLVDEDDSSEEDEDELEDEEDLTDEEDESDEDETDTEQDDDGQPAGKTDEIDYKSFYEAVTGTEFVVNGRKTKGFVDPKKIIQAQQMAGGFSEKMAGFKKYRPYMAPLQERGMLEDQSKFDLAMNLVDGDVDAIKHHIKTLGIDPLDLDMDAISYSAKSTITPSHQLVLDDALESARSNGVEDKVRQVIGQDWDQASFDEFLSNGSVRNDLIEHLSTGAYDIVQERMSELKRTDVTGAYSDMTSIQQYRSAVAQLQAEQAATPAPTPDPAPARAAAKTSAERLKAEKAKIAKKRQEDEYKVKAEKERKAVADRRKKAASMSKRKPKAKPKAAFDPMKLEGQDFDDLMEHLISSGRNNSI